ncbi:MAG: hypothetical protein IPH88_13705 [Bacteroidales bacterium]|nr:hypothetical protein [Bacteroidales bacterium]
MKEFEDWFKIKKYPHIGKPIKIKDYDRISDYVNNPEKVRKHSFLPFIHKTILKRKYRANKINLLKNPSGKRRRVKDNPKERPIYYSSHIDAMVFSKYNSILIEAYEKYIENEPYNESIVAYRKIPVVKGKKGNKCNIDFTKAAFEYIKINQGKKLTVIVADITSFFDSLNHKILKRKWAEVLNHKALPPDHFNLFKTLTRIKYVESAQLFDVYNQTVIVERGVPCSSTKKEYKKKRINSIKYFREKNVISYCYKDEFLKNNLSLIKSKNNKTGIPQGSPISATLANIYMLDFDRVIYEKINLLKGYYQRYSDDIIIVCERQSEEEVISLIRTTINGELAALDIESKKTKLYHFEMVDGKYKGFAINEKTKEANYNLPLNYLGFSFDGQRVLIKNAGFSKFYRSMKKAFNMAASFAIKSKNPDKTIFKSRLYKRFTYKGANRRLIFRPLKSNPKVYKVSREFDWGNYLTYVYKANETMKAINENNAIRKQSRKVWRVFHKLLSENELKVTKN